MNFISSIILYEAVIYTWMCNISVNLNNIYYTWLLVSYNTFACKMEYNVVLVVVIIVVVIVVVVIVVVVVVAFITFGNRTS